MYGNTIRIHRLSLCATSAIAPASSIAGVQHFRSKVKLSRPKQYYFCSRPAIQSACTYNSSVQGNQHSRKGFAHAKPPFRMRKVIIYKTTSQVKATTNSEKVKATSEKVLQLKTHSHKCERYSMTKPLPRLPPTHQSGCFRALKVHFIIET